MSSTLDRLAAALAFKGHDARGLTSFWSLSLDGGRPRLLVRFDDPLRQSSRTDFAADRRNLYFAINDRESDVFVADLVRK